MQIVCKFNKSNNDPQQDRPITLQNVFDDASSTVCHPRASKEWGCDSIRSERLLQVLAEQTHNSHDHEPTRAITARSSGRLTCKRPSTW
eukprot:3466470-Amphidinium_carterae.1